MKTAVKYSILFLVLLSGILYLIQFTLDYFYKKRATDKYALVLNHKADPEVMIYGPSSTLKHFSCPIIKRTTGFDSYNMGYDGMFFLQFNALIKEHLTYEKNCKYVVIGCNMFMGKDYAIRTPNSFYPFVNEDNVYNSLEEIEPRKIFLARYMPGYKLTLISKGYYMSILYNAHKIDSNHGYEPILDTNHNLEAVTEPFLQPYDEYVYTSLKSTVNAITAKGIKVVLVICPIYEKGFNLIINRDTILQKYQALADNKNVFFLDYTKDSLCKNRGYFNTNFHMGIKGAEIFSKTFSNDLLKIQSGEYQKQ